MTSEQLQALLAFIKKYKRLPKKIVVSANRQFIPAEAEENELFIVWQALNSKSKSTFTAEEHYQYALIYEAHAEVNKTITINFDEIQFYYLQACKGGIPETAAQAAKYTYLIFQLALHQGKSISLDKIKEEFFKLFSLPLEINDQLSTKYYYALACCLVNYKTSDLQDSQETAKILEDTVTDLSKNNQPKRAQVIQQKLSEVCCNEAWYYRVHNNHVAAEACYRKASPYYPQALIEHAALLLLKEDTEQAAGLAWKYFTDPRIKYPVKAREFILNNYKLWVLIQERIKALVKEARVENFALMAAGYSSSDDDNGAMQRLVKDNQVILEKQGAEITGFTRPYGKSLGFYLYKWALYAGDEHAIKPLFAFYVKPNALEKINTLAEVVDELWQVYFKTNSDKIKTTIIDAMWHVANIDGAKSSIEIRQAIYLARIYSCLLHDISPVQTSIYQKRDIYLKGEIQKVPEHYVDALANARVSVSAVTDNKQQTILDVTLKGLAPKAKPINAAIKSILPTGVTALFFGSAASVAKPSDETELYSAADQKLLASNRDLNNIWLYLVNFDLPFDHKIKILTRYNLWEKAQSAFKENANKKPSWEIFVLLGDAHSYSGMGKIFLDQINEEILRTIYSAHALPVTDEYAVYFYKKAAFYGGSKIAIRRLRECYKSDLVTYVNRLVEAYFAISPNEMPRSEDAVKQVVLKELQSIALIVIDENKIDDTKGIRRAQVWFCFLLQAQEVKININATENIISSNIVNYRLPIEEARVLMQKTGPVVSQAFKEWADKIDRAATKFSSSASSAAIQLEPEPKKQQTKEADLAEAVAMSVNVPQQRKNKIHFAEAKTNLPRGIYATAATAAYANILPSDWKDIFVALLSNSNQQNDQEKPGRETEAKDLSIYLAKSIFLAHKKKSPLTSIELTSLHAVVTCANRLLGFESDYSPTQGGIIIGFELLKLLESINISDFYLYEALSRCYSVGKHDHTYTPDYVAAARYCYLKVVAHVKSGGKQGKKLSWQAITEAFDFFIEKSSELQNTADIQRLKAQACYEFFKIHHEDFGIKELETLESILSPIVPQPELAEIYYQHGKVLLDKSDRQNALKYFDLTKRDEPSAALEMANILNRTLSQANKMLTADYAWHYFTLAKIKYSEKVKILMERNLWVLIEDKFTHILKKPTPEHYHLIAGCYFEKLSTDTFDVCAIVNKHRAQYPKACQTESIVLALYKLALFSEGDIHAAKDFVNFKAASKNLITAVDELWQGYFTEVEEQHKKLQIRIAALNGMFLIATRDLKSADTIETMAISRARVYFWLLSTQGSLVLHDDQGQSVVNPKKQITKFRQMILADQTFYADALTKAKELVSQVKISDDLLISLQPKHKTKSSSSASAATVPNSAHSSQPMTTITALTHQRDHLRQRLLHKRVNKELIKKYRTAQDQQDKTKLILQYLLNLELRFEDKFDFLTRKGLWNFTLRKYLKQLWSISPWEVLVLLGDICSENSPYPILKDACLATINTATLQSLCATFTWPLQEKETVYLYKVAAFKGGNKFAVERLLECYENSSAPEALMGYVDRLIRGYREATPTNLFGTEKSVQSAMLHGLDLVTNKLPNGVAQNDVAILVAKVWFLFLSDLQGVNKDKTQVIEDEIRANFMLFKFAIEKIDAMLMTKTTSQLRQEFCNKIAPLIPQEYLSSFYSGRVKTAAPLASSNAQPQKSVSKEEQIQELEYEIEDLEIELNPVKDLVLPSHTLRM